MVHNFVDIGAKSKNAESTSEQGKSQENFNRKLKVTNIIPKPLDNKNKNKDIAVIGKTKGSSKAS